MFFLSTLHTICADMLIIHCTLFLKAIFLSSIRFFDTLVIFNKASKTLYIELFPLVGLLLGFAARGGVLVLGHVTDHRTPIYAAPVAPSFLESTPLHTNNLVFALNLCSYLQRLYVCNFIIL